MSLLIFLGQVASWWIEGGGSNKGLLGDIRQNVFSLASLHLGLGPDREIVWVNLLKSKPNHSPAVVAALHAKALDYAIPN